jgi:phage tail-like protein
LLTVATNGVRWWQLEAADFEVGPDVRHDRAHSVLRLRSARRVAGFPSDRAAASAAAAAPRAARDPFGTWARIAPDGLAIEAGGADLPDAGSAGLPPTTIVPLPAGDPWAASVQLAVGERATDCAWGDDGVLYCTLRGPAAGEGRVLVIDRRRRWRPFDLRLPDFAADRCAADPVHGVWLLDRDRRRLARIVGRPLPERGLPRNDAELGRLVAENRDPPRLLGVEAALAAGECVDLAVDGEGRALVLAWTPDGASVVLAVTARDGVVHRCRLPGVTAPFALAAGAGSDVLVLGAGFPEAVGFSIDGPEALSTGDIHPLPQWDGAPFVRGPAPAIGATATRVGADGVAAPIWWPQDVRPLLVQRHRERGRADARLRLDGGIAGTPWGRLHVEAAVPVGTALVIRVATSEAEDDVIAAGDWAVHVCGRHAEVARFRLDPSAPRAAWMREPSDAPYHRGFLCGEAVPGEVGQFGVWLQRGGRRVRSLTGRFLHVQLELLGDGVRTPEVAAVRVHGPRFSYRDRYLPEHWGEELFGREAHAGGPATGPDFVERLLANVESVLSPIEAKIADAHLLHDPRSAPAGWLDWLGGWIGVTLDGALDERRRRACLTHAVRLYRRRGTLAGLLLALDLATGGEVACGGIVVVEDFRLRRTFATILGADLADEDDPLLRGLVASGNSIVGDTLFVGEDERTQAQELLALFGASELTAAERDRVRAFYAGLANRVTVLVHRDLSPADLGLVQRVVERETPAHVGRRVLPASEGLRVGLTALVDVDTWLRDREPFQPARVDVTTVGRDGIVTDVPTLDPRMDA